MTLLIVLALAATPAGAEIQGWRAAPSTSEVQDQNALLKQAVRDAAAAGVDTAYAARVIGKLRRYIEDSTSAGNSTVCLGMVVDVVKVTSSQNWTVERASQLLIELQRNLEVLGGRCSSYRGSATS